MSVLKPEDYFDPHSSMQATLQRIREGDDPIEAAMARALPRLQEATQAWLDEEKALGTRPGLALMGLTKAIAMDFASIIATSAKDGDDGEALIGFGNALRDYLHKIAEVTAQVGLMQEIRAKTREH